MKVKTKIIYKNSIVKYFFSLGLPILSSGNILNIGTVNVLKIFEKKKKRRAFQNKVQEIRIDNIDNKVNDHRYIYGICLSFIF